MYTYLIIVTVVCYCYTAILFAGVHSAVLQCKDENNRNVDWYINYKLPKIGDAKGGSMLKEGKAYAYLTPGETKWFLSSVPVTSEKSMLGNTWNGFKDKISTTSYLFYNDDAPEDHSGSAVGHLKGLFAFNGQTGFWLIHSVPRFIVKSKYEYPVTGLVNGQIAMCISFKATSAQEILSQLRFSNPNIYDSQSTPEVLKLLDANTSSLFKAKSSFITKAPFSRQAVLFSAGGLEFLQFSKDNQLKVDLFSKIIAPGLKTSLVAQTWRRGRGTFLPPFCATDYTVTNIHSMKMKASNEKEISYWSSKEDHSKWAISVDGKPYWVCISDLNRMESQSRRGGGAICFRSKEVWGAFRSVIVDSDMCQI